MFFEKILRARYKEYKKFKHTKSSFLLKIYSYLASILMEDYKLVPKSW